MNSDGAPLLELVDFLLAPNITTVISPGQIVLIDWFSHLCELQV